MTGVLISRRSIIASILGLSLTGCSGGDTAVLRYRVIATCEVEGKLVEASTVMEARYSRVSKSLVGAGGATLLFGEALIFKLPNNQAFFILPVQHEKSGPISQIWETAVLQSIGVKNSIGGITEEGFKKIRNATGRMPFQYYGRLPSFVAFHDETNPKSIFELDPKRLSTVFTDTTFKTLEIEITDEGVTEELKNELPWLSNPQNKELFPRDPPGHLRAEVDSPLPFLLTTSHFFGSGSR